nr:coiled-coil domain-containing protein 93-like isoform X1 [Hydra vulgaris]
MSDNIGTMVETREDEEQGLKLNETIDLLLAAGYFRARIKGLSPFDKVVGGMTWCITLCDFDVDVDLLFQENSTIGQRIALTEKIVAVLPKMKCPHQIEPHQIQGLDFRHIFPVVQWLVKRAIETREELGDQIRLYSISQFSKKYSLPQDDIVEKNKDKSIKTFKELKNTYNPKRLYKKPSKFAEADEETQVYTTLLEYGRHYVLSRTVKSEKETNQLKKENLTEVDSLVKVDSSDDIEKEEDRIKSLMGGMSQTDLQEILTSRAVGSIVGLQSDEITQIVKEYAERKEAFKNETSDIKVSGLQAHKRDVAVVEKNIKNEKEKLEEVQKQLKILKEESIKSIENYEEKVQNRDKLKMEMEKLERFENDENSSVLSKLRSLVALNEKLKQQEREFKAQCKIELEELEGKIKELQSEINEENVDDERIQIINEQFDNETEKLKKYRLHLAKRNREIASLQWKIDDVPSRAELSQYQKRFIELYNQVASTHKETKQFYTFFNTLDDTKLYLEKEIGLLNSIHDNFKTAMLQSASSKDEFLTQLAKIMEGVQLNKEKVEKRRLLEKEKKDKLNDQCTKMVEKQRLYFNTVRDFQEECKKNEIISTKLAAAVRN